MTTMQVQRFTFLALVSAMALLQLAAPAAAQDASRRCLDSGVKPILRNADGSLTPNPEFDNCLAGRQIAPPPAKVVAPAAGNGQTASRARSLSGASTAASAAPGPAKASSVRPVSAQQPAAPATAAAAPAQPPAVKTEPLPPPAPVLPKWTAGDGQDVQEVLTTWAKRAGWTVVWNAPTWQVAGNLTYEGEFLDAVRGLMRPYVLQRKLAKPEIYPEHNQNLIYISESK
jgi:hypothetical protein